jgi:hypothetical protein
MKNCDPGLGRPLLRPRRPLRGGEQQPGSELPPPHAITLSAAAYHCIGARNVTSGFLT